MNTTLSAETYGLKPAKSKKCTEISANLRVLLDDPLREKKLTDFEATLQLPRLHRTPQAPYAREARYLLMHRGGHYILPETARNITNPSIWCVLAGLN